MSLECGECERDLRGGHADNCELKIAYEQKHPPCPGRCGSGNPCTHRLDSGHTEEYYRSHYSLPLQHYCDDFNCVFCSEV